MVRYLIFMSYIGTRYRGAVKQLNCERLIDLDSVQGAFEVALRTAFHPHSKTPPLLSISSRTDAGVHALCNTAQVELDHPENVLYDTEYITAKLNIWFARCGHEIRVTSIYPITPEFNVRRSAKSRTYFYRCAIAKKHNEHKLPIAELGRTWNVKGDNIDIEASKKATSLFVGKKNFSSFSPKNKTNRKIDYVRELISLTVDQASPLIPEDPLSHRFDFWKITVKSRSFVYNQVRRIVGALIGLASGKISEGDITTMLQVPSHFNWDDRLCMAPPQGLYLKAVEYDAKELASSMDNIHAQMDLKSLIQRQKKNLKPAIMYFTNEMGKKFEIFEGVTREIHSRGLSFVVDEEPDLQIASVAPGLFLSSQDPVFCPDILKCYGIRHILSLGIDPIIKFDYIKYHYMEILDLPEFDITLLFNSCIKTINSYRDENILVHCNAGVSRSPAIVIGYLMIQKKLTFDKAYDHVKAVRNCIHPNDGFVKQLKSLDIQEKTLECSLFTKD